MLPHPMKGKFAIMTEKIKDIIEKGLKAIKALSDKAKKLLPVIKKAFFTVADALKHAASFVVKVTEPIRKWALPHIIRFAEFAEPKIIRALEVTIKKLEEMSENYEKRRIARSKLTKKEKFLRYFPRATVTSLIVLGVLYIIGVYHLYLTGGDTPFSRESVGSYLVMLAIPSAITVIMLIVNTVLTKIFPKSGDYKYDGVAVADFKLEARLEKLVSQFDVDNAPNEIKERIKYQYKREKNAFTVAIIVTVLTAIYSAAVVFNTSRYTIETVNSDIAGAMLPTLFCTAIALCVWSAWSVIRTHSRQEVVFAIKDAIRENKALYLKTEKKEHTASFIHSDTAKNILRGVIIAASVALIALGIMNGGMADVLDKAVKICTECIGLG